MGLTGYAALTPFERQIEAEVMDLAAMMNARHTGYQLSVLRWQDEEERERNHIGWSIVEGHRGASREGIVFDRDKQEITYVWLNVDCMYERQVIELDEVMLQLDMSYEARWFDEYLVYGPGGA